MATRTATVQFKRLNTDSATGAFTGLAATFSDRPDRHGDIIERGAFAATLGALEGGTLPLLFNHDEDAAIGAVTAARETDAGLEVEGIIVTASEPGARAYALAKAGGLSFSFGYTIRPGGSYVDDAGVQHLTALDLYEISLVPIPANTAARVVLKRADQCNTIREFEALARDALGLSNRVAKAVAAKSWPCVHRDGEQAAREALALDSATVKQACAILRASNPV